MIFKVTFTKLADAQKATAEGFVMIDGKRCNCNIAGNTGEVVSQEKKIFIGGLSPTTTQESLMATFAPFGEIVECKLIMDKVTGQSKGYGFVCDNENEKRVIV
jgi:hypothetical protein